MGYTSDFFKKKRDESETTTQPTESFGSGSFDFDPAKFSEQFKETPAVSVPMSEAPKFNPGLPSTLPF